MPKNILTLYHGSTFLFTDIDVSKGKAYKDFGMGFYTTKIRSHAVNLALRNKRIEDMRFSRQIDRKSAAYLYTYALDLSQLQGLTIKEFHSADKDWMQFVLYNRKSGSKAHDYDIVIGPTADDDTRLTIRAYFAGAYGDIESDNAINTLISQIESENLPPQFYFGSNKAASLLIPKNEVTRL